MRYLIQCLLALGVILLAGFVGRIGWEDDAAALPRQPGVAVQQRGAQDQDPALDPEQALAEEVTASEPEELLARTPESAESNGLAQAAAAVPGADTAALDEADGSLTEQDRRQAADAHCNKARELLAAGKEDEAERELLRALKLVPGMPEAGEELAGIYGRMGDEAAAAGRHGSALLWYMSAADFSAAPAYGRKLSDAKAAVIDRARFSAGVNVSGGDGVGSAELQDRLMPRLLDQRPEVVSIAAGPPGEANGFLIAVRVEEFGTKTELLRRESRTRNYAAVKLAPNPQIQRLERELRAAGDEVARVPQVPAKPCEHCGGKGQVACGVCGGRGVVEAPQRRCDQCGGDGRIDRNVRKRERCPDCVGAGTVQPEQRRCHGCGGRGLISATVQSEWSCPHCSGSGTLQDEPRRCHRCGGSGQISHTVHVARSCPQCGGSGGIQDEETRCSHCGGDGGITRTVHETESCPACGGDGELTSPATSCRACKGDGQVVRRVAEARTCPKCNGKGTAGKDNKRCTRCGGDGEIHVTVVKNETCPACSGAGSVKVPGRSCGRCGGDGRIERAVQERTSCPHCGGRGATRPERRRCGHCGGDGSIEVAAHESRSCSDCGGRGATTPEPIRCHHCGGDGRDSRSVTEERSCPDCAGTGSITPPRTRCARCRGGGQIDRPVREAGACARCAGRGRLAPEQARCRHCGGGRRVKCVHCDGRGRRQDVVMLHVPEKEPKVEDLERELRQTPKTIRQAIPRTWAYTVAHYRKTGRLEIGVSIREGDKLVFPPWPVADSFSELDLAVENPNPEIGIAHDGLNLSSDQSVRRRLVDAVCRRAAGIILDALVRAAAARSGALAERLLKAGRAAEALEARVDQAVILEFAAPRQAERILGALRASRRP